MITRHTDEVKAYKDAEYWFKQGYSVGILYPGDRDEFYTVYVDLTVATLLAMEWFIP